MGGFQRSLNFFWSIRVCGKDLYVLFDGSLCIVFNLILQLWLRLEVS